MSARSLCSKCGDVAVVISDSKMFCADCFPTEKYIKSPPVGNHSDTAWKNTVSEKTSKPTVIRRRLYEK